MKKVSCLLLSLLLVLALSACFGKEIQTEYRQEETQDEVPEEVAGNTIEDAVLLYNKKNLGIITREDLKLLRPECYWTHYEGTPKSLENEQITATVKDEDGKSWDSNTFIEQKYGSDYTCSVEILNVEYFPEEDIAKMEAFVLKNPGIEVDIQEACTVTYTFTICGTLEKQTFSSGEVHLYKIDGYWYLSF